MSDIDTEDVAIDVVEDEEVRENWDNLFQLLDQPQIAREENKGLIDQVILQLLYRWLGKRDQCGVIKDLMDVALYNVAGSTLDGLAGEDLANYLAGASSNSNTTDTDDNALVAPEAESSSGLAKSHGDDRRYLQFFTDDTCSSFQSTIFLGSMLSFSSCANVDIGKFFGTIEENIVNVGLHCINTLIQPFQREKTCASRNFQNYVMDQCVQAIIKDDIIGHIFQLFLVSPKQTCGCMSALASVPTCRIDITSSVSLDGMLTSKIACVLESQVCSRLEEDCSERLDVLDECLPDLFALNNDNFDCAEIMCECEKNDRGLLNYPGKAMELPMSDMCVDHAVSSFVGSFIPERYAVFQEKCGAEFINQEELPPSAAPSVSLVPTEAPTDVVDPLAITNIETQEAGVNSVVSGILLALAITGIASICLVFVLILWRRRFRSGGKQVQTIAEMKAEAQEQIRKLEEELRRIEDMEEMQREEDEDSQIPSDF